MHNMRLVGLFVLLFLFGTTTTTLAHTNNPLETNTVTISRSLNYDAQKKGINPKIVKAIVRAFSWEIDFNRDLKKGDKFIIVTRKANKPEALIYLSKKKQIAVFSYTDKRGRTDYYDRHGKSLQKSFLSAPLKYDRVSSKFQKRRFHPILKTWLPHRAVDFAAKTGTPVYSTADGVIKRKKRLRALGNVLFIQHGKNYTTVYAHLSRFAKGIRTSKKVKKGQIIGYVGSTGRSTGPHLHYEIRYKGVRKNPLTYKLPKQKTVANADLKNFKNRAKRILSSLRLY